MLRNAKKAVNQTLIVVLLLALQLLLIVALMLRLDENLFLLSLVLRLLSIFVVLYIVSNSNEPNYKLAWIIPIMIFPLFGGLFYLVVRIQRRLGRFDKRFDLLLDETSEYCAQDAEVFEEISKSSPDKLGMVRYFNNQARSGVVRATYTEYLPTGEKKYAIMLELLRSAKRYIFLEYFIVREGKMWDGVLEILKEKASQGVDVRLMMDGVGSSGSFSKRYFEELASFGIKARVFSPFVPFLSVRQNNRDHRKICVVDGVSAITGGVNIADEYINETVRFGHWADSAVLLRGDAAFSFAVIFMQMWLASSDEPMPNFELLRPTPDERADFVNDGFVCAYSDSPNDEENVGENVYLDIINGAKSYVWIQTPYLILDSPMSRALEFAAKRGVQVRLMIPGIPDKRYAYSVASSYFEELIDNGVEIYSYTPGFMHSKTFVCDDKLAVVGSINLDFRSLYLHFECAAWMLGSTAVGQLRDEFLSLLPQCKKITSEECRNVSVFRRLLNSLLRLFAPLM